MKKGSTQQPNYVYINVLNRFGNRLSSYANQTKTKCYARAKQAKQQSTEQEDKMKMGQKHYTKSYPWKKSEQEKNYKLRTTRKETAIHMDGIAMPLMALHRTGEMWQLGKSQGSDNALLYSTSQVMWLCVSRAYSFNKWILRLGSKSRTGNM